MVERKVHKVNSLGANSKTKCNAEDSVKSRKRPIKVAIEWQYVTCGKCLRTCYRTTKAALVKKKAA